ncbi:Mannan endo-1,6-alpha-mannosidase DCW1 [Neolecta irregularis DAH-3]|uniref:mannan endo-1,6-alpha-mannosidase n=1 Tax=Neolecta irregularis (strain DAH-3) TaxID=1198029 RepID=A0A1U7LRI3_NEOID|nr:Mannan endo-1,6-alpha-mannosidase DCW1 [Neolecta irregularis DAH-3]|eukprot:OLL25267.1 Mannan endo-1,6-alpha-mannosidase DCW1 [Neolecta irregularis DAH-3]
MNRRHVARIVEACSSFPVSYFDQPPTDTSLIFVHFEGFPSQAGRWVSKSVIRAVSKDTTHLRFGPRGKDSELGWADYMHFSREFVTSKRTGITWSGENHSCPCIKHDVRVQIGVSKHPERRERLEFILGGFQRNNFLRYVHRIPQRKAAASELALAHSHRHIFNYHTKPNHFPTPPSSYYNEEVHFLANVSTSIQKCIDISQKSSRVVQANLDQDAWPPERLHKMGCGEMGIAYDTTFDPEGSPAEARLAVGSLLNLLDSVLTNCVQNGFAIIRPPGHHAEPEKAMGFCIYNNISIAARYALQKYDTVQKVLIIDFDIHHGNGTELVFYDDPNVLYISIHRWDDGNYYPTTGDIERVGEGVGLGRNVNIGFSKQASRPNDKIGDPEYVSAFFHLILPIARQFEPDLVLVSAGFDAAEGHPEILGGYHVTPTGFALITSLIKSVSPKLLYVLEGGYELTPLTNCATACLGQLIGHSEVVFEGSFDKNVPNESARNSLSRCRQVQAKYWKLDAEVAWDLPKNWRRKRGAGFTAQADSRRRRRLSTEAIIGLLVPALLEVDQIIQAIRVEREHDATIYRCASLLDVYMAEQWLLTSFTSLELYNAALYLSMHCLSFFYPAIDVSSALNNSLINVGSLTSAAGQAAAAVRALYTGDHPGQVPGLFPSPTFWWEAGAAMNALIDYRVYTNDTQYDALVMQAMMYQVGANNDYLPANQTFTAGNDDQGFWGLAAMSAAETGFPNPPKGSPQWISLVETMFNEMTSRWDTTNCKGGLRWQISMFNSGYNYKNSISNGVMFQMAARLAYYTGNSTYSDWADKIYSWMGEIQFMDAQWNIYDGATTPDCTHFDRIQWTYNNGMLLGGAAYMYNITKGSSRWQGEVTGLLDSAIALFFKNGTIIYEPACEPIKTCDDDQVSFKGYLARNMGYITKLIPSTAARIFPVLASSVIAGANSCQGTGAGMKCGMDWTNGAFDGKSGLGEQLAILETIQSMLVRYSPSPLTTTTGGTSVGGSINIVQVTSDPSLSILKPPTTSDKVGSSIVTILTAAGFMCMSLLDDPSAYLTGTTAFMMI